MGGMRKQPNVAHAAKRRCLRPESARSLLHAERYSRLKGRWLNTAITISFPEDNNRPTKRHRKWRDPHRSKRPCRYQFRGSAQAYEIFRSIWDATRRRWNRSIRKGKDDPFDSIAVFERKVIRSSRGRQHTGPVHVHWLLRWPKSDWERLLYFIRRKLAKVIAGMVRRDVDLRKVDYQVGFAKYMAKGIDPPYARTFYLKYQNQGTIEHRRIIVSRSLGMTKRKRDLQWQTQRHTTKRVQ